MVERRRRRNRSPIAAIIEFFMDASLDAAEQALTIAQTIVERKREQPTSAVRRQPARGASAASAPPAGEATAEVAPAASRTRRRRADAGQPRRPRLVPPAGSPPAGEGPQPAAPTTTAVDVPAGVPSSPVRRRRPAVTGHAGDVPPTAVAPLPDQALPPDE